MLAAEISFILLSPFIIVSIPSTPKFEFPSNRYFLAVSVFFISNKALLIAKESPFLSIVLLSTKTI